MATALLKLTDVQLGVSPTATNNFTWYQPASPDGTVRLGNGNSGAATDLVTVTSAGNVGIGTSSPGYKLDVQTSGAPVFNFQTSATNGGYGVWFAGSTTTYVGSLKAILATGNASDFAIVGTGANNLVLGTNSAERMRIDASGNVGIGTSSPTVSLDVRNTANEQIRFGYQNTTNYCSIGRNVGTGSFNFFVNSAEPMVLGTSNTERMRLDPYGNIMIGTTTFGGLGTSLSGVQGNNFIITATYTTSSYNHQVYNNPNGNVGYVNTVGSTCSYINASDYRLKENVRPLANGLDSVLRMKPVEYNWKADGAEGQGFLAHELQEVVPQAATGTKDEVDSEGKPVYQGIDPRHVVAFLVAAIQELKAEIDQLKGAA